MQLPSITLIASAMLLSTTISWSEPFEHAAQKPFPEVLPEESYLQAPAPKNNPIPMPEPPRYQPAPRIDPVPLPEPPRHPGQRPAPRINPVPMP